MSRSKGVAIGKKVKEISKSTINGSNKIVIRRLPPTLSSEIFLQQVSPLSEYSYYYFMQGDLNDCPFSRAYFCFVSSEDIIIFQEKFDGYIFLDEKGNEYPSVVEYAPCNRIPLTWGKFDHKANTIDNDPDYLKFLEAIEKSEQENVATSETVLEDNDGKEKLIKSSQNKTSTPLVDFMNIKNQDKRQAALLKAKQKEDERKKRQALKEQTKPKIWDKYQDVAEPDHQKQEPDQDKIKYSSKPMKGGASKPQISEDSKLKDKGNDKEYFNKGKNVFESQRKTRESDSYRKGKSKQSYPKDRKAEDYDNKAKNEKHTQKSSEADSKSFKGANLDLGSSYLKHESTNDEVLSKKIQPADGSQEKHEYKIKKEDYYRERKDSNSRQRLRYKDRPERAIYKPGHKKEKQEEAN